jgi:phage shock protein C
MSESRTRFYLDKRNGKIMGVCAGIADYFGWDVTLVRIAFVLAAVCGVGSPVLIYLLIGLVANSIR